MMNPCLIDVRISVSSIRGANRVSYDLREAAQAHPSIQTLALPHLINEDHFACTQFFVLSTRCRTFVRFHLVRRFWIVWRSILGLLVVINSSLITCGLVEGNVNTLSLTLINVHAPTQIPLDKLQRIQISVHPMEMVKYDCLMAGYQNGW